MISTMSTWRKIESKSLQGLLFSVCLAMSVDLFPQAAHSEESTGSTAMPAGSRRSQASTESAPDSSTPSGSTPSGSAPSGSTSSETTPSESTPPAAPNAPYALQQIDGHYMYHGREISEQQYNALLSFNKAYESFKRQDYQAAEQELRKALDLAPGLIAARTDLGLILGRLGKIDEAIRQLKQVVEMDPQAATAIAVLAGIYQGEGRLPEAVAAYRELINHFPDNPYTPRARQVVQDLESEIARENEIQKTIKKSADAAKDYFPYISYDYMIKWSDKKLPLKVYVPTDEEVGKVAGYKPQYGKYLRDAFQAWSDKSNNAVSFAFVPTAAGADIDCKWSDDPTKVSRPSERGEAKAAWDDHFLLTHVQIILLTRGTEGEGIIPDNLIQAACLHEVGHGLGIAGHSPDSNDAMFCSMPTRDTPRQLTERDGQTLAHLYSFHEGMSSPNDKVIYNNQGVAFAQASNYKAAREKFQAALAADSNYEPAKRNLGAVLNNLGNAAMREGKWSAAEACFKQALELQKTDPDQKRRSFTFHNYALLLKLMRRTAEATAMEAQYNAIAPK
jgi:tetratricopeptide (TPR) repeat protein